MKRLLHAVLLFAVISCGTKKTPADLIIKGGTIYTVNEHSPVVEAVAVTGDRITYAGDLSGLRPFESESTKVIDLQGRTMTPGFIESHGHLMALGFNEMVLDLSQVRSYEELVGIVRDAVNRSTPGQWIIGRGWHQDKWDTKPARIVRGFPTHQLLSQVSPDNPVYLWHTSGHAALVNARAMQLAGVNQLSVEQLNKNRGEGGEIIRDPEGNPTGVFNEQAMNLISQFIPPPTREINAKALQLAQQVCLENGITSFQDAGLSHNMVPQQQEVLDLYHEFKKTGGLHVRMYLTLSGWDLPMVRKWFQKGPEIDDQHFLTIRAIKLNCDGALGSRGAWLLAPYSDQPGATGMPTYSMDSVLEVSREALKNGFQVWAHAIGDRANHEILDRYEMAFKENPEKAHDCRFRIEHAQHLAPSDIPRFGKLGVIASMQAIHLSSDRPWAIERLGEKRIVEGAYKWQSLLKSGAVVINGTDVPVEPISPVACFFASVTRQTLKGMPPRGYEPAERMTREQALRSYTLDAAFGAFEEKIKGSVKAGKLADFTIFSQDIMKVPDADLLGTQVMMTIVGGKVLFEK